MSTDYLGGMRGGDRWEGYGVAKKYSDDTGKLFDDGMPQWRVTFNGKLIGWTPTERAAEQLFFQHKYSSERK